MERIKVSADIEFRVVDGVILLSVGTEIAEIEAPATFRRKLEEAGYVAMEQIEMARQRAVNYAGRCQVHLIHEDKSEERCVLPKSHLLDDSDHQDIHGHRAPVLVHQSTIREVQAVQDARDAGLIE